MNIILALVALFAFAMALRQAAKWYYRPLTKREVVLSLKAESLQRLRAKYERDQERKSGHSANIIIRRKFGPLGVRAFRAAEWIAEQRRMARRRMAIGLANVGEGFHPLGLKTFYPTDVVPNGVSNPYTNARYSLVKQAPPGTTLGATLQWGGLVITSDDLCTIMAAADISIPLGIAIDEPGNSQLDTAPFSTGVQLLGNAAGATLQGITDKAIAAGTLLVGSQSTAGNLSTVPNVAGLYWCVGLSLSTSEGAQTLIEFDGGRFVIGVDEIT